MRFVRYIEELTGVTDAWCSPQWGLLTGDHVLPLRRAPYLERTAAGGCAPEIVGPPRLLASVRLVAPVTPSKLVCVGRNYAEHAAELGNQVPPEPLIFLKPPTTLVGPDTPVIYPAISQRVDHEAELAVVIGVRCRRVAVDDAAAVIFGYTIANDVTARDLQKQDGQWTRGKGFDTFAPVGPWIDTAYEPANRRVCCRVNGEVRQDGNTALMIYSLGRILAHITQCMTLEAGDVVLTGTPAGVGPVQPGDVMSVEVEGLGVLSNPVVVE